MGPDSKPSSALLRVKLLHTAVWLFFVGCIAAVPLAAARHRFDWSAGCAALVLLECAILAVNGGRCPLTDVAARHTTVREHNFDIFLPLWLARYNKQIFGTLFAAGGAYALGEWWLTR